MRTQHKTFKVYSMACATPSLFTHRNKINIQKLMSWRHPILLRILMVSVLCKRNGPSKGSAYGFAAFPSLAWQHLNRWCESQVPNVCFSILESHHYNPKMDCQTHNTTNAEWRASAHTHIHRGRRKRNGSEWLNERTSIMPSAFRYTMALSGSRHLCERKNCQRERKGGREWERGRAKSENHFCIIYFH